MPRIEIPLCKTVTLHGVSFEDVEFDLVVDAKYVDDGIGPYEFWGAKGTHHAWVWEWELEELEVDSTKIAQKTPAWTFWSDLIYDLWDEDIVDAISAAMDGDGPDAPDRFEEV